MIYNLENFKNGEFKILIGHEDDWKEFLKWSNGEVKWKHFEMDKPIDSSPHSIYCEHKDLVWSNIDKELKDLISVKQLQIYMNAKVVCIKNGSGINFTLGKVYNIEEGIFVDDIGDSNFDYISGVKITTLASLNNIWKDEDSANRCEFALLIEGDE